MKKTKILIFAMAIMIALAVTIWAVSYDSATDPLVTLSYITDIFKPQIDKSISSTEAALRAEIDALNKKIDSIISSGAATSAETSNAADTYEIILLSKGEQIIAKTQCQIILRMGTASVVSAFENQGIADLTDGIDLAAGGEIKLNHQLLVPRGGDGRGIIITSDSAYIMVRGEYSIAK